MSAIQSTAAHDHNHGHTGSAKDDKTMDELAPDGLAMDDLTLDDLDRRIINHLQRGLGLSERPYQQAAMELGISEEDLLARLQALLDAGVLSRFGPLYQVENMGGRFSLAAMKVPQQDFDRVAEQVNQLEQVAHNYQREHAFNMWFVIATETPGEIDQVIEHIEKQTGLKVYNMPKLKEFYLQLQLPV